MTGQKNETGELVKTASARMWDRMSTKQVLELRPGRFDHKFQSLDARNPAISANIRL
jgi:hypothetical protein